MLLGMSPQRTIALLLLGVAAACDGTPPPGAPPLAKLSAPGSCDLGSEMVLDARGSSDPDGDIVLYRFVVADGTAARDETLPQPAVKHVCQTAGLIEVALQVIDSAGNDDWARATVSARRP